MIDFIKQPWQWYIAGPLIGFVMLGLLFLGKSFGISANFRTICTLCGAGRRYEFFNFNWKTQKWNLIFLLGTLIGGFLAKNYLTIDQYVNMNNETKISLSQLGFKNIGQNYLPDEIFNSHNLDNLKVWAILLVGGFLVGFGTRYAGGCTSGHAISGLSNLQLPSLIAVIGFFIGGLIMSHIFLPLIF